MFITTVIMLYCVLNIQQQKHFDKQNKPTCQIGGYEIIAISDGIIFVLSVVNESSLQRNLRLTTAKNSIEQLSFGINNCEIISDNNFLFLHQSNYTGSIPEIFKFPDKFTG